jgi:hypothetical protein
MELLIEAGIVQLEALRPLMKQADELLATTVAAMKAQKSGTVIV